MKNRTPFAPRRARVLAARQIATATLILSAGALGIYVIGIPARAAAGENIEDAVPATDQKVLPANEDARLSLSVQDAPMSQVFSLVEAMTQLRARYAAPPSALLSAHLDEEPLLPALGKMLDGSGWKAQRDGDSLFLRAEQNANWQVWTGEKPPRTNWNLPPGAREYSRPAVLLTTAPDAPSRLSATFDKTPENRALSAMQTAARAKEEAAWKSAPLQFDAWRSPGIAVEKVEDESAAVENVVGATVADASHKTVLDADATKTAVTEKAGDASAADKIENGSEEAHPDAASTRGVWMRCDVTLRVVPSGLALSIATPAEATLWINGAPLWSRRSGQIKLDVSRALRPGINRVALRWENVPASAAPLLRYEWHVLGAS